jgi:hypothetical protein
MEKIKARAWEGGAGGGGGRKAKKSAMGHRQAFNGVVELDAAEYARFEQCMTSPGEPTQATRMGAALLRKLYRR